MQELVRVAVDAMGGDHAPQEIVKGAVEAVNSQKQVKVYLVGKEAAVQAELQKYQYDPSRVEVVDAAEVIGMAEPPVQAIRTKKDSSIWWAVSGSLEGSKVWSVLRLLLWCRRKREPLCSLTAEPMWMPGLPTWYSLRRWVQSIWSMSWGYRLPGLPS